MKQLKHLVSLTCDFEEYIIELDFLVHYLNAQEAKEFASYCVHGVELSCTDIKIIVEHSSMSSVICKCCKIKKMKNEAMNKAIIDIDEDYIILDSDASTLFNQLCIEYGMRTSFIFPCSSYSVKEC